MDRFRAFAVMTTVATAAACGGTEPSNAPPVAAFSVRCSGLACTFEDASTDDGGAVAAHAWSFGDDATSSDASPTHTYAAPGGHFIVKVVVTDNDGAKATMSRKVSVSAVSTPGGADNRPPVAAFAVACTNLTCRFTDQSTDPDAGDSLVSHAWSFGDGQSSAEPSPEHAYGFPGGSFTVSLVVTDRHGAVASTSRTADVTAAPAPDVSGTYVRETPHSSSIRDSRFVIRADGTFDYIEDKNSGERTLHGRWRFATSWGGWPIAPGGAILLDFDGFVANAFCGESFGSFLMDGHLGVSYCGVMIDAGLEEGVYTDAPDPGIPDIAPPQPGQIAFSRDGRIYRANTDGTGLVQLTAGPGDGEPAWSPDGTRIAFSRGGESGGIYVMTADGANPVRVASPGRSPTWSADGQLVAFSCPVHLDGGICAVRADDGTRLDTLLVRQGQVTHPAWSPDGMRIAYSSDWNMFDFWFDIWVMPLDGSEPTVLRTHTPSTPGMNEQYQPAWSPDGRRIALVECPWAYNFCSSSAITVMNADGSGLVRIAAASVSARPSWSPDGQILAFASAGSIDWVSADGSQRGRIIADGTSPAWRPR